MPVDSLHSQVSAALPEWKTVRDCIAGHRAIVEGGELYLPRLSKQPPDEYRTYQERAVFFNAASRTLEAMVGLLFRKPPELELPDVFNAIMQDADTRGNPFVSYARDIANEVCAVGRAGTLIDWNQTEARPYFSAYTAENILNWRTERVGGRIMMTILVLRENATIQSDDDFAPESVIQYRVIRAAHDGAAVKAVTSEIWQKNDKGEFILTVMPTPMLRKGSTLPAIPFVFHNADKPGPDIGRVPLSDLAHVNVAHFRTSADLENGRHICGLPTPYAFGLETSDEGSGRKEYYLGASYAWTSSNPNAKAGFLEFTGQGLGALEKGLTEKEAQMAALGARLIEPPKKDAEAYETVQLRAGAEASTLARIGMLTTESLLWALAWAAWWQGTTAEVKDAADGLVFSLNKDFVSTAITPEMLTAIVAARQANLISRSTMFFNLQRGEFFPDNRTVEEEADEIDADPPMPAPLPTPPPEPAI